VDRVSAHTAPTCLTQSAIVLFLFFTDELRKGSGPWCAPMLVGLGREESRGQCPAGPWLLYQAAGGHSAPWRRHLVRAGGPPPPPLALPPLALRGSPVRLLSVRPYKPKDAASKQAGLSHTRPVLGERSANGGGGLPLYP
jgi:hypothetical protein